jgi:metal-responsive CopG/Arc/MetJ family transcriptional regulator
MNRQTIRTTLNLPKDLLEAADDFVKQGKAKSRNDFIAQALRRELEVLKRAEIDADLAQMADDAEYQAEVLQLEAEFASAQWEALEMGESQA